MVTQALTPVAARDTSRRPRMAGYLGAAAFVVATAWYALATLPVTGPAPPHTRPGVPADVALRVFYHWFAGTLLQQRLYLAIAIGAFAAFAAVALLARQVLDPAGALAAAGARAITAGVIAYGTGTVIFLGGHQAVGLMATHDNPIQVTNSIAFTIDTIDQAFDLTAYALFCTGMAALAWAGLRQARRGWAGYTAALALLALLVAWSYGAGGGGVTNDLLFAGGLVLLPAWLVWTSRLEPAGLPEGPAS
jgi:hypothetical protein